LLSASRSAKIKYIKIFSKVKEKIFFKRPSEFAWPRLPMQVRQPTESGEAARGTSGNHLILIAINLAVREKNMI
jgi:hypothetical protein